MKKLTFYLLHANLVLGLMMITFLIVDCFNQAMAFLNNGLTKGLLLVFSLTVIAQSAILLYEQ